MQRDTGVPRKPIHGLVTISLDTERMWGYFDLMGEPQCHKRFPGAEPMHDRLLQLLVQGGVSATWAVVGGLALDSSAGAPDERLRGLDGSWTRRIPAGDQRTAPLWYARDFIRRLRDARPVQEIGLHGGLTHLPWGAGATTAEHARWELRQGLASLAELGIEPRSFVYPRDLVAQPELLAESGFGCYRGRAPIWSERFGYSLTGSAIRAAEELAVLTPPPVWPVRVLPGLWNLPASMPLYSMAAKRNRAIPLRLRLERVRRGLEAAARRRGVFHLALHPENLAEGPDAFSVFESVGKHGIGKAVGGYLPQLAEEQAENEHGEEGLDDRPCGAERGLLVANLDVAPDEEVQQLAVVTHFP